MRFFALIMAILVLGLCLIPCSDEASVESGETTHVQALCTEDAHAPDHAEEDICSPFCNCSCCASNSINYLVHFESAVPELMNKVFASSLSDNISEVSLPIWQPPQLSI